MKNHFVYILYSQSRKMFYVGMTSNMENRLIEHNSGESAFTSSGIPWELLWCTVKQDEVSAIKLEKKIKNLSVQNKLDFIERHVQDLVNQQLFNKLF